MKDRRICSPECMYLSPTEAEQDKQAIKAPHRCGKYDKALSHGGLHPNICRLSECTVIEVHMKLSEKLAYDHASGDFGAALDGYSEQAAALERELEVLKVTVRTFLHDLDAHEEVVNPSEIMMNNGMWLQVAAFRRLVA